MGYVTVNYINLFDSEEIAPFFEKGYGLELILRLYDSDSSEGIEHLYKSILCVKPSYACFHTHIHRLVDLKLLCLTEGRIKKSMKSVSLCDSVKDILKQLIKKSAN